MAIRRVVERLLEQPWLYAVWQAPFVAQKFAPESVASIKVKPDGLNNDLHASPEYRAHLITVMAKRAVEAALK